jgi:hypothetical protein
MDKFIVFRVAWMEMYGAKAVDDVPMGAGRFVALNQTGSEIYNFRPCQGRMYGFVEPGFEPEPKGIRISRLGASKHSDQVSGVLVIWAARRPDTSKLVVVGWYEDATVHRRRQSPPDSCDRLRSDGEQASYFVEADEENCELIPVGDRFMEVPEGTGGIGQMNLGYLNTPDGTEFKSKLSDQYKLRFTSVPPST